jgi:hypothetical protein
MSGGLCCYILRRLLNSIFYYGKWSVNSEVIQKFQPESGIYRGVKPGKITAKAVLTP